MQLRVNHCFLSFLLSFFPSSVEEEEERKQAHPNPHHTYTYCHSVIRSLRIMAITNNGAYEDKKQVHLLFSSFSFPLSCFLVPGCGLTGTTVYSNTSFSLLLAPCSSSTHDSALDPYFFIDLFPYCLAFFVPTS